MGNSPTAGEARSRSFPKAVDRDYPLGTARITSSVKPAIPSVDEAYVRKLKNLGKPQPSRFDSFDSAEKVAAADQAPGKQEAKQIEKSVEFCSKFFIFARTPINTNWGATFCDEATLKEAVLHRFDSRQPNPSELSFSDYPK